MTRRSRDDDGRTEDGRAWFDAPQTSVERIEPAPWSVPTPQLGDDPTAWLTAMCRAMSDAREADEARSRRRIDAAPRRSMRRVS